jgi:cytochrome c oxidase assembly protein subunit 11
MPVKGGRKLWGFGLAFLVVAMVGAAFAAVPLYRAFCQATGFNGVARRVEKIDFKPTDRRITVRFDTNVRGLPWTFSAEQVTKTVQLGKANLAYFKVKNTSASDLTGRAVYNLYPEASGAYVIKTQCFCFNDQKLKAGEEAIFPVIFYVDPKFAADSSTAGLSEITLSYTFYPAPDAKAPTGKKSS